MSYKHNNLMAMRQNYWNDNTSLKVTAEKNFFQQLLIEHNVFTEASLEDAKYFFFTLPSIIIVKGYACGFEDQSVKQLLEQHIDRNKDVLISKSELQIEYQMR